jgi:hypothetical protein
MIPLSGAAVKTREFVRKQERGHEGKKEAAYLRDMSRFRHDGSP